MKKVFFFLTSLFLFSGMTMAQNQTTLGTTTTLNIVRGGLEADSFLKIPVRDTLPWYGKQGDFVRKASNGKLYYYSGTQWKELGNASGGTVYHTGTQAYITGGDTVNFGTNIATGEGAVKNGTTYLIYGDLSVSNDIAYAVFTNTPSGKGFTFNIADTAAGTQVSMDESPIHINNFITKTNWPYAAGALIDTNRLRLQTPKYVSIIAKDSMVSFVGVKYKVTLSDSSGIKMDTGVNGVSLISGDNSAGTNTSGVAAIKGTIAAPSVVALNALNTLGGGAAINIGCSRGGSTGYSFNLTTAGGTKQALFTDFENHRGIEYPAGGAYDSNATDNTLITKRYADLGNLAKNSLTLEGSKAINGAGFNFNIINITDLVQTSVRFTGTVDSANGPYRLVTPAGLSIENSNYAATIKTNLLTSNAVFQLPTNGGTLATQSYVDGKTISAGAAITSDGTTTTYTINMGFGQTGYQVSVTPSNALAAAALQTGYYITNKSATHFDIVFSDAPGAGTITLDYTIHKN